MIKSSRPNQLLVPFYISLIVYFSDKTPSRRDSISLWELTRIFPKNKVDTYFYQRDDLTDLTIGKPCYIGDTSIISLCDFSDETIYGGGSCPSKNKRVSCISYGYDFYYIINEQSRWFGLDTPPYAHLSFNSEWIRSDKETITFELLMSYLKICDNYSPCYAMIDISPFYNSFCGLSFGSMSIPFISIDRRIEQYRWLSRLKTAKNSVRGIYWGNYISNRSFSTLQQRKSFISRFESSAKFSDNTPNAFVFQFKNGIFISLSRSISDCFSLVEGDMVAGENACLLADLLESYNII